VSGDYIKHTFTRGLKLTIYLDKRDAYLIDEYKLGTIKPGKSHTRYVTVKDKKTGKYITLLHRLIMKAGPSDIIDHENGNGLNNRRSNLRKVTKSQNQFNRRLTVNETKGVYFRRSKSRWVARIGVNNKQIHLGYFDNKEEATLARLKAEKKYHKEHAGLGTENLKWH